MMRPSRSLLVLVSASLALAACKKKQPPAPAPTPVSQPAEAPPTRSNPPATATPRDTMAEYNAAVSRARESLLQTIYFEYDSDELRDDSKAMLDQKIRVLNASPSVRVRIAGHCDSRGGDEYNIALGRRRAEAAKRYLTDRGIDASRIETSSFGAERPAVQGDGEEVWSKNRRDEFEIVAGADQIRPAR